MSVHSVAAVRSSRRRPLSDHAKVALNRQIARDLANRIDRGELTAGAELPSEAELAAAYGVNRLTVRQALSDLARQGLVKSTRGRRTTVATPPVRYRLDQRPGSSLTSAMDEQGIAAAHEFIATSAVKLSDAPLPFDGGDTNGRGVRFDYVRWVDGRAWSRSATWIPRPLAPARWEGDRPVLDLVAAAHDLEIRRAIRCFAALPATLDDAEVLDVPVGSPLLRVTGTSVDQHDRTVAVVRHYVVGDRAEYVVDLAI